jgi:sugar phosphate isomerase/epimerase
LEIQRKYDRSCRAVQLNKHKNPLGVMQGRLLPKFQGRYQAHPVGYWQDEFAIAAGLGLDCIEFILDFNEAELNPLLRPDGPDEILRIAENTCVQVRTICADYFMEAPLHHANPAVSAASEAVLRRLLASGKRLCVSDIVIPCVDQSSLANDINAKNRFVQRIVPIAHLAETLGINLSLETDLPPHPFADLLARINSPRVTVNYDIGNSAALGFDPAEEMACYGKRVSDIHIKDRKLGGGSVPLGSGDARFDRFFQALEPLQYKGPFIMQAYRDDEGLQMFRDQLNWLRANYPQAAS